MKNSIDDDISDYKYPRLKTSVKKKIENLQGIILHLEKNFSQEKNQFFKKKYKILYENELNPSQLDACSSIAGKTLVIAGAGSGKTRTLTYRMSYLIENQISPEKILILTFTRKAAEEIKIRVNNLLKQNDNHHITSGTFHSFCNLLLIKYAKLLDINPRFTILDQEDSRDLLDLLRRQENIVKKEDIPFPRKAQIQNIISMSRNKLKKISTIMNKDYYSFKIYIPEITELSQIYHQYKRNNHLYDYDDLIDELNVHLKSNLQFKECIHARYQHIMVDEYQDTNIPQKEFIDLLSEKKDSSLMVVGDDNQSIYAFRGANYENILLFGKTYPDAKLIKLEQNYRSTPAILDFINNLSDKISLGYRKKLFSDDKIVGHNPQFIQFADEEAEATFIADTIIDAKKNLNYKEIAILSRAAHHTNFIQMEFATRNIPFIVVGGIKFMEKRHIKDILAYIKIIWNPFDIISWHRILTLLDGIGNVRAGNIVQDIKNENGKFTPLINKSYIKDDKQMRLLYMSLNQASDQNLSLIEIFHIMENFYIPILKKIESDWEQRIEDFKVLKILSTKYSDIEKFLSNLALDPPNEKKGHFKDEEEVNKDAVTISTVHSSKGLEWTTVFVTYLLDGAFPHYKSFNDYEQMEEERKLFYVACSRVKQNLYLTAPQYSKTYTGYFDKCSRFINEVDNQKYQNKTQFTAKRNKEAIITFECDLSEFYTHKTFLNKLISKVSGFFKR